MLQSMGLQRVGHDWATEPNRTCFCHRTYLKLKNKSILDEFYFALEQRLSKQCTKSPMGEVC